LSLIDLCYLTRHVEPDADRPLETVGPMTAHPTPMDGQSDPGIRHIDEDCDR
jgi:hypothetical protein